MAAKEPVIGVTGCKPELPVDFPLDFPENSGNMIHASAPLRMFSNAFTPMDERRPWGNSGSFRPWVNRQATHLIVTMANSIRLNRDDLPGLERFQRMLESYDVELVIFGLGVQAPSTDLEGQTIAPQAVELMKYLGERCKVVGVRGEFTKKVFEHFAGVTNTFVTGCPSLFSNPQGIEKLRINLKEGKDGKAAYAGTNFNRFQERKMLLKVIEAQDFLIEPVNAEHHRFYLQSLLRTENDDPAKVPSSLRKYVNEGTISNEELSRYFRTYYRLFRDTKSWADFYAEAVRFSYGSRFHVNMASLLAGVPALWVTHDARTQELVDFLHLPSIPLEQAANMEPQELEEFCSYDDFMDNIASRFENFNDYLDIFDLPKVKLELGGS